MGIGALCEAALAGILRGAFTLVIGAHTGPHVGGSIGVQHAGAHMGISLHACFGPKRPPMTLNGMATMPHTADSGLKLVAHGGSHMGGAHGGGQAGAHDMDLGIAMDGPLITKPGPTGTTVDGP